MTPASPEAVKHGCVCPPQPPGRVMRSWRCPIHGCTCLADWRSGERVRNPGCNLHGTPTPEVK